MVSRARSVRVEPRNHAPHAPVADLQRTTGIVAMTATVTNQRGETVLEGRHVYLLRL